MSETKDNSQTRIKCCDCGTVVLVLARVKPKELAKQHGWKHAGTGRWRCGDCATRAGGIHK